MTVPLERQKNISDVKVRVREQLGLGSAAVSNTGDFATAAQGEKAESALPTDMLPITATRNGMEAIEYPAGLNSIETRGYAVMGVGRAAYVRVEAEPAHALKVRSLDRYLPSGSTDAINGGWWEIAETTIHPEMAGAKGNGLVADDVPLKNCLEYLRVKGGGKLRLTGYSYRLSAGNLPLYDHISIEGNLFFTEIKTDAGLVAQVFFNPERLTKPLVGVTISGLILNGQAVGSENFAVSAISIEGLEDVTIERCVIKNTSGYGFGAQASTANPTYNQPAKRLKLKDILFIRCGYNLTGDPSDAVDIKTVDGLEITNCTVQGAGDNGFNVRGQNLVLRGNRAFDCANCGFTIANGQSLPCDVSLFDNKAFNCGVDGLQLVVANVAGAVALRAFVVGFESDGNVANGVRVYEAGGTTGNLYLTLSDISTRGNGFNGVNQAVPNAKSVVASNIRAEENVASGVATSGSREVWTAISSNRNGLNGIREGAGANDNRFIGPSCDDNVGNEIVLVGSRSMVFGQSGDAPTAIRTGYAENWVNNFFAEGRQAGGGPRLGVEGPDANIPVAVSGKGNLAAQFFSDSFGTERARIDVPSSGNVGLMVFVHDGSVQSLRRVSVGAADSGGSGFRILRVPNN